MGPDPPPPTAMTRVAYVIAIFTNPMKNTEVMGTLLSPSPHYGGLPLES